MSSVTAQIAALQAIIHPLEEAILPFLHQEDSLRASVTTWRKKGEGAEHDYITLTLPQDPNQPQTAHAQLAHTRAHAHIEGLLNALLHPLAEMANSLSACPAFEAHDMGASITVQFHRPERPFQDSVRKASIIGASSPPLTAPRRPGLRVSEDSMGRLVEATMGLVGIGSGPSWNISYNYPHGHENLAITRAHTAKDAIIWAMATNAILQSIRPSMFKVTQNLEPDVLKELLRTKTFWL